MTNRSAIVSSAFAGVFAGFFVGRVTRSRSSELRKLLNGNDRLLTSQERTIVSALIETGHGHLFRGWPPPGTKDQEKRLLVKAAADKLASSAGLVPEHQRLAVLQPPMAPKKPKLLQSHGKERQDEYYWLRDDVRKAPAVLEHLRAENEYTRAVLADTEKLQEALYAEMRGRIQEADQGVPVRHGPYYYYSRTLEGQQYRIHCRRRVPPTAGPHTEAEVLDESQPEEVLLDENKRKEEGKHSFYMVGAAEQSPNHKLYAWTEDIVGGEKYLLHVKDLATGKDVMQPIAGTSGDIEWANDNKTLFYVVKDELDRPYKVFRHNIMQPSAMDVLVYEEKDEAFYVGLSKSRSDEIIFITSGSSVTSEMRFIRADQPESDFQVVLPRVQDVEYSVAHRGQHLYITLRDKQRPNSELSVAPIDKPTDQKVLLPHSKQVKIESVKVGKHYLVVFERSGGLQRARVFKLPADGVSPPDSLKEGSEVAFEEPAYELMAGSQGDFDSPVLRMLYSSLTTPLSTIDLNMATGKRAVKKVQPVLGGFKKEDYVTERHWATAADGVNVPISLVYRKQAVKLDGTDPLLLNGYGSYEISNDPDFNSNRLCLLDRGWIFAIAHIRGGGEMGREWYETGKFLHKKNTFKDFITCAEYLIAQHYTSAQRLSIEGRSAGGLLMGAVLNMRPDLFKSAIMGVPFVDVLTTISDESIPLTIIEWEEWGNPKDPAFYKYIKEYSPVDNIRPADYPHILATAGLHDPRVGYWEPAKFVAKLRATKTDNNLLLLKCDLGAGHFSVTGRFERLKEVAVEYAFLLKTQGML